MNLYSRLFLFFLLGLYSPGALASRSDVAHECVAIYRDLNRTISRGYVTLQSQAKLEALFAREDLSTLDQLDEAFQIVWQDRLALLPPDIRREAEEILHKHTNRTYRPGGGTLFGGATTELERMTVILHMPISFQGTIVEYAILTHELEHIIQELVVRKQLRVPVASIYLRDSADALVRAYYGREVGAMLAESEFLRHIPEGERARVLAFVKSTELLDPTSKEFAAIMLMESWRQPAAFVRRMHEEGRYDLVNIRQGLEGQINAARSRELAFDTKGNLSTVAIVAGLGGAYYALEKYCERQPQKERSDWCKFLIKKGGLPGPPYP